MPVSLKIGPDGCLYVLDWYDRYHCSQDAARDPDGVDRLKGRLYRLRYGDTPRAPKFDLATESDDQLIARLGSGNIYLPRIGAADSDGAALGKIAADAAVQALRETRSSDSATASNAKHGCTRFGR